MALRSSRVFYLVLFLGALALTIWGCGGLTIAKVLPPGTIKEPAGSPILGTFTTTTISSSSVSSACPGSINANGTTYSCVAEVRTYNQDGTWTATNPSGAASGTYSYDSSTGILTVTNNGTVTTGTATFGSGNDYFDYFVTATGITTRWVKK